MNHNEYSSRRGVVACALSHWSIANHLTADTVTSTYIVLEDDIELHPQFAACLEKIVEQSKSLDVCFLGYTLSNNVNADIQSASFSTLLPPTLAPFSKNHFIGATFGYLINKSGAAALSSAIET
jgi:GR25 family glycosyltransferase involved in LPS biosynthesis